MSRTYLYEPGFDQIHQATNLIGRCAHPTTAAFRRAAIVLRAMLDASREGLAAHRHYERLRSRGVPHGSAISAALGMGVTPTQATREAAKSLYFVGRV